MRVIAGIYGGRVLKSPADNKIRPTSDRLRETLFNILAPYFDENSRFLDLCAGTGAIGIEALSRGVSHTTFVDRSRRACAIIEENLDSLNVPEEMTSVSDLSAETFCGRDHPLGWDIVYFDPPYAMDYTYVLLEFGKPDGKLLNENGILIVEHHGKTEMPDLVGEIRRWRILKQGETRLSFYERS